MDSWAYAGRKKIPATVISAWSPCIGELTYAGGSVSSPYGTIRSSWEKKEGVLIYSCEIPPNTGATPYSS